MTKKSKVIVLWAVVFVQAICAAFFITEFSIEVIGRGKPLFNWQLHELVEIAANVGLVLGLGLGVFLVAEIMARNRKVEGQLRVVSGEFNQLLEEHFKNWALTPSEKDVAYFAIKGMSNAEISDLRETSEGTVKAQMNAVYKKAGVVSRTQLLGYFIEELMADKPVLSAA